MAIVFECPVCEFQGKAGDELQGKEIKCKACGHAFALPESSSAPAKTGPAPVSPASGTVAIKCPGCGAAGKAPAAAKGKKIKCPKCSQSFTVPNEPPASAPSGPASQLSDAAPPPVEEKSESIPDEVGLSPEEGTKDVPAGGAKPDEEVDDVDIIIDTVCPQCKRKGAVPEKFVGKKIKCAKCGAMFTVTDASAKPAPGKSNPPATGAPARPGPAGSKQPPAQAKVPAKAKPGAAAANGSADENPFSFDHTAPPSKKEEGYKFSEEEKPAPQAVTKPAPKRVADDDEDDDERGAKQAKTRALVALVAIVVLVGACIYIAMKWGREGEVKEVVKTVIDEYDPKGTYAALKPLPSEHQQKPNTSDLGPKGIPAPIPQSKDPNEGQATIGDVFVRVMSIWVDYAKNDQKRSKNQHVHLKLLIMNKGKDNALEYRSWASAGRVPGQSDLPILTDNKGKIYRRSPPADLGFQPKGHVEKAVVPPGGDLGDLLLFELPSESVEAFRLELPAVNIGKEGKMVMVFPGAQVVGGKVR